MLFARASSLLLASPDLDTAAARDKKPVSPMDGVLVQPETLELGEAPLDTASARDEMPVSPI